MLISSHLLGTLVLGKTLSIETPELYVALLAGVTIGVFISYLWPAIRWWIFPTFLLSHIILDSVMHYEHEPFMPFSKFKYWGWFRSGTKTELALSSLGLAVLFFFFRN